MSVPGTGISQYELHGTKPLAVTVATTRKLSGLGNTTIWALIKSGELESVRVHRRRLILYHSLERLLPPTPSDSSHQPPRRGRPAKALRTTV